jgi:hypothetical protein
MAQPKSIFPELESNAEPMNGVRRLKTVEEDGHDPLVDLRDGAASAHDHRYRSSETGCRGRNGISAYGTNSGAGSFHARQVARPFVLTNPPTKPQDRQLAELAPAHDATGACIEKMRSADCAKHPRRMLTRVPIWSIRVSIWFRLRDDEASHLRTP